MIFVIHIWISVLIIYFRSQIPKKYSIVLCYIISIMMIIIIVIMSIIKMIRVRILAVLSRQQHRLALRHSTESQQVFE